MRYETINPATEESLAEYPLTSDADLEAALERSVAAFAAWRRAPLEVRVTALRAIADLLESRSEDLARLMAREMGKPVAEGEAEAAKCAWVCRHYAEHAAGYLEVSPRESDGRRAEVRHEPLGPILAIMPWNFPLWQFFRFAGPALAAGNTVLLKHAPNTPGCAVSIEGLVRSGNVPAGVVQNLFLSREQAAGVIADRRVRGVTLTGSTAAGREVAAAAGAHLKPMVLELGGSDPFVVFADADIERAAEIGATSRCLNNGQSCIAAKRFLVQDQVFDRFRDALVDRFRARTMGDPAAPGVTLGPLARRDLRDRLAAQVEASRAAGARVVCGGELPQRPGWFYPATVLEEPPEASPAYREELFGPVAALFRFRDEESALSLANDTGYGLGASVWTRDAGRAERLAGEIDAGAVFVNGLVKSDPRLPFGGIKESGFGRELGREGILEFVNRKTVWFA